MYHLGWFLGAGIGLQSWNPAIDGPWSANMAFEWMKPDIWVELAASLERAGFDFLLIEDTSQVGDTFRGSAETTLRLGMWAPKFDPMPFIPLIAERTKHIGVVPTVTSTFYPPYLAARLFTTLDHITQGRVGFNLVTAASNVAAQNYGIDALPPKDERYAIANEWVDVFKALQRSWDPDAVIADVQRGIYADHTKVHRLDHAGKYFKCRGPLNIQPGPQRAIPMVEPGNSDAGRDFAARTSEAWMAVANSVEEMKQMRVDMHARMIAHARDPADLKIMFVINPLVAASDEEAMERARLASAARRSPGHIEQTLWYLDQMGGVDFGSFDLDMTGQDILTAMEARGDAISTTAMMFRGREGQTLADIVSARPFGPELGLVGSPETVAAKMDEIMEEVGGDGFLITSGTAVGQTTRHYISEICDGLAPVLRRRGSIRSDYQGHTFRDNLAAF